MIEKLIKHYQQKKSEQELLINEISADVRRYRKDGGPSDGLDELLIMRKGKWALVQAYVQFIIELKEIAEEE